MAAARSAASESTSQKDLIDLYGDMIQNDDEVSLRLYAFDYKSTWKTGTKPHNYFNKIWSTWACSITSNFDLATDYMVESSNHLQHLCTRLQFR